MTGGRMGAEGDPTTIIVYADVYTQETPSTSEHELSVIMSSSDPAQASISTTGFDVLDEAKFEKININPITSPPTKPTIPSTVNTDADAIEEAVPIVQTTLPVPELEPKIEKNGIEMKTKKKSRDEPNDECLINCIYYTQQCCDCTIV